jgi:hypothetical protein
MAVSAHQKVSPMETVTAPRTTLKTLTLPLVPGLAVPGPGGDVVDVPVLHEPAELGVPRGGYSHLCSPFPGEKCLLVMSGACWS